LLQRLPSHVIASKHQDVEGVELYLIEFANMTVKPRPMAGVLSGTAAGYQTHPAAVLFLRQKEKAPAQRPRLREEWTFTG
jgi:hypothetical protein